MKKQVPSLYLQAFASCVINNISLEPIEHLRLRLPLHFFWLHYKSFFPYYNQDIFIEGNTRQTKWFNQLTCKEHFGFPHLSHILFEQPYDCVVFSDDGEEEQYNYL